MTYSAAIGLFNCLLRPGHDRRPALRRDRRRHLLLALETVPDGASAHEPETLTQDSTWTTVKVLVYVWEVEFIRETLPNLIKYNAQTVFKSVTYFVFLLNLRPV